MTLVLSELSSFGVAMAADSAVTFENKRNNSSRVYIGAQKLLPVYKLNAGIAVWGLGRINNTDSDVWLQKFIKNEVKPNMGLWNMANKLAEKLNEAFDRIISERMGVHVAGFDTKNGIKGPAFYHVHNGHYHVAYRNGKIENVPEENPAIREFRAHEDRPPATYQRNNFPLTRNGDFAVFALLHKEINPLLNNIESMTGLKFPYPSNLATRGEYLRFWINTIVGIYRLSSARKRILTEPATAGDASIGGPITVLTISKSGIESFYTK